MPDFPDAAAELAAIRAEFAVEVFYTGGGFIDEPVQAVESEEIADSFVGPGETLRRTTFEIGLDDLPTDPAKGHTLIHPDGTEWRVIEFARRRDIGAWLLTVEVAA